MTASAVLPDLDGSGEAWAAVAGVTGADAASSAGAAGACAAGSVEAREVAASDMKGGDGSARWSRNRSAAGGAAAAASGGGSTMGSEIGSEDDLGGCGIWDLGESEDDLEESEDDLGGCGI